MRRALTTVALATLLTAGVAGAAAAAPAPTPSPTVTSSPGADNTAEVCAAGAKTVDDGLAAFVDQLDKVSDTANGGDLVGAEKALKDAGTSLITLANNLRADADRATAQNLKTTLTDLAGEFETQGKSLDRLSDLQSFDTKRLEAHAARMEALCGLTPSASPSVSPWPSPSPSR